MKMKKNLLKLIPWLLLALLSCAPTITAKDRSSARIRYDIAIASLNQGDLRGALRELLGVVQQDPNLPQARNALGLVYHSMGRLSDSLEQYQKAVELDPHFSEAHNNLGVLLLDMARYGDAIESFKKALSDILYATPYWAEGNMGWAYFKNGNVELALQHLRNAVATNPKFCRGYGWLAEIELAQKEPSQAVAYCKRFEKHCLADPAIAANVTPEFVREMQYHLGRAYVALGDRDAARQSFSACTGKDNQEEVSARCERALKDLE
jgi:type IV pilus assembly protein PilF